MPSAGRAPRGRRGSRGLMAERPPAGAIWVAWTMQPMQPMHQGRMHALGCYECGLRVCLTNVGATGKCPTDKQTATNAALHSHCSSCCAPELVLRGSSLCGLPSSPDRDSDPAQPRRFFVLLAAIGRSGNDYSGSAMPGYRAPRCPCPARPAPHTSQRPSKAVKPSPPAPQPPSAN